MITVIPSNARGESKLDWLDSKHTFSFADYYNPDMMGFGPLRVINEDWIAPGQGFGAHPHRNMEIITYVVKGALEHKDSMGSGEVLRAGEVQRMTAGRGVVHSEFNASQTEPVHLFQIWIIPDEMQLQPGYEQKKLDVKNNEWTLAAASGNGRSDGAVSIHQNVRLFISKIEQNRNLSYSPEHGNAWLQVISGAVRLGGKELTAGDAAALQAEDRFEITALSEAQVLLFDIPR